MSVVISREEQALVARRLKIDGPKTDMQLWQWASALLGFDIAYRPTCAEHQAPFDFLADAFFMRFGAAIVHGARGGGKTRNMSLLHQANCHYKRGFRTIHVGALLRQAGFAYDYLREYVKDPYFADGLETKPTMTETRWRNGSRLQITPGTIGGTSGPHPNLAVCDEFDLLAWEVYQQFIGMAQSTEEYRAQTIYTSAQTYAFGPMARLMEEAVKRGLQIYRSCIFDVMRPCDGEFGGKGPTCEDAVAVQNGGPVSNPPRCPLWNDCQGRARYATGHITLSDVINKYHQSDEDTWMTQYLCKRGSRQGLVYEKFDGQLGPLGTTNVSVEAEYKPELPVIWMCDDGYHPDPMVLLAANLLPNGDVHVFDEMYLTRTLYETMLGYVHGFEAEPLTGRPQEIWPWSEVAFSDELGPRPTGEVRRYKKPAAAYIGHVDTQLKAHLATIGVLSRSPSNVLVMDGLKEVRKMICDANGHRGLVFHPRCLNSISHFEHYHRQKTSSGVFAEEPANNTGRSNPDDACDSVRMFAAIRLEGTRQRIQAAWKP